MFKELLEILRSPDSSSELSETLERMIGQAAELVTMAGACLFDGDCTPEILEDILHRVPVPA